jgi:UDP-3-O-[3-hydroxymyristoyl] N-acetylglucosamine deacetylase
MGASGSLRQTTLASRVRLSGIGVHSGKPVSVTLGPGESDTGIAFLRTNVPNGLDCEIPASFNVVASTELCTVLGDPAGGCVATVEHLLAAFAGLGIDNALVEIDGPEVPVMDGSAAAFVEAIDRAGVKTQRPPRRFISVLRPVRVELGSAFAEFLPYDGRRFEVEIDFDCPVIGRQAFGLDITPKRFRKSIARARTFGHMRDVERMWAAGYALGSSLENSVVIGDGAVINPEGLRYPDEFVRHKMLDAIGDLALSDAPIRGLYRSYKGGHKLNAMALSALLADKSAWRLSTAAVPAPREKARLELGAGILAPAFAPEAA